MIARLLCLLTLFFSGTALAASGVNGRYVLAGSHYAVDAEFAPGQLTLREIYKTSVYREERPGYYVFVNENNRNIRYAMEVVDAYTLKASKPDSSDPPTYLKREPGPEDAPAQAPAEASPEPAPLAVPPKTVLGPPPVNPVAQDEEQRRYAALAEEYQRRSQTEPVNAQAWTACAAVAFERAHQPEDAADRYARKAAEILKMLDAKASPCPEVIREW